jgi:protein-tyrosine phosphatase
VLDIPPTGTAAKKPTSVRKARQGQTAPTTFSITVVCRANLCRSPIAEYLLKSRMDAHQLPVRVMSAGTHADAGMPMHPLARQALGTLGIEPGRFVSKPLDQNLVDRSDLILTMTDAQRSWVAAAFPGAVNRTYLLSQFSRLVAAVPETDTIPPSLWGSSLLRRAVSGRGLVQPLREGRDIEDPIGKPLRQFVNCARTIEQRLEPLFAGVGVRSGR